MAVWSGRSSGSRKLGDDGGVVEREREAVLKGALDLVDAPAVEVRVAALELPRGGGPLAASSGLLDHGQPAGDGLALGFFDLRRKRRVLAVAVQAGAVDAGVGAGELVGGAEADGGEDAGLHLGAELAVGHQSRSRGSRPRPARRSRVTAT